MLLPNYSSALTKVKTCSICGRDITGLDREICYYCEVDTTDEIRPLMVKKRLNVPDI